VAGGLVLCVQVTSAGFVVAAAAAGTFFVAALWVTCRALTRDARMENCRETCGTAVRQSCVRAAVATGTRCRASASPKVKACAAAA